MLSHSLCLVYSAILWCLVPYTVYTETSSAFCKMRFCIIDSNNNHQNQWLWYQKWKIEKTYSIQYTHTYTHTPFSQYVLRFANLNTLNLTCIEPWATRKCVCVPSKQYRVFSIACLLYILVASLVCKNEITEWNRWWWFRVCEWVHWEREKGFHVILNVPSRVTRHK